jgi:NTP pyrophosphatase (non-canonical NTP hydrolase)
VFLSLTQPASVNRNVQEQVNIEKYTAYSHETGITKTKGQSTVTSSLTLTEWSDNFIDFSIPFITTLTIKFATDRNFRQYDTPRNIVLAMYGELGELAELFQFKGDNADPSKLSTDERDKIGQEIADITLYLLRLANVCDVELKEELGRLADWP